MESFLGSIESKADERKAIERRHSREFLDEDHISIYDAGKIPSDENPQDNGTNENVDKEREIWDVFREEHFEGTSVIKCG